MINKELYRLCKLQEQLLGAISESSFLIETQKFPPECSNYSPDYRINRSHHESNLEYIRKINITRCQKHESKCKVRDFNHKHRERERVLCSVHKIPP